jgi:hypothetical protein
MTRKNTNWTTRQLKRLAECYAVMPLAELAVEFAPHSPGSIQATANKMGVRRRPQRRNWVGIAKAHVPVFTFKRKVEVGE